MGLRIQNYLYDNNFKECMAVQNPHIKMISTDDLNLELTYRNIETDWGENLKVFNTITYQGKKIWSDVNESFDSGVKEIKSAFELEKNIIRLFLEYTGDNHPYHEVVYFLK